MADHFGRHRFITETARGAVWARPAPDRRIRSLVTFGIPAANTAFAEAKKILGGSER